MLIVLIQERIMVLLLCVAIPPSIPEDMAMQDQAPQLIEQYNRDTHPTKKLPHYEMLPSPFQEIFEKLFEKFILWLAQRLPTEAQKAEQARLKILRDAVERKYREDRYWGGIYVTTAADYAAMAQEFLKNGDRTNAIFYAALSQRAARDEKKGLFFSLNT